MDKPESRDKLKQAYNRIFTIARENILNKKKLERKEVKIININHEEEMLHLCAMRFANATP